MTKQKQRHGDGSLATNVGNHSRLFSASLPIRTLVFSSFAIGCCRPCPNIRNVPSANEHTTHECLDHSLSPSGRVCGQQTESFSNNNDRNDDDTNNKHIQWIQQEQRDIATKSTQWVAADNKGQCKSRQPTRLCVPAHSRQDGRVGRFRYLAIVDKGLLCLAQETAVTADATELANAKVSGDALSGH